MTAGVTASPASLNDIVGTITGAITLDYQTSSGVGQRFLTFIAALGVVVGLIVVLWLVALHLLKELLSPELLFGLFVIACLLGLMKFALFGRVGRNPNKPRSNNHSVARVGAHGGRSAAHGIGRLLASPFHLGRNEDASVEVRRFRVTDASGMVHDCELFGEISGASLRQGDGVNATGRRTRSGTLRVRRLVLTANGAIVSGRNTFRYGSSRIANVVAGAVVVALIVVAYSALK